MEVRPGTLRFSQMQAFSDLLDRKCRLLTQSGCQSELYRMALALGGQIVPPAAGPPVRAISPGEGLGECNRTPFSQVACSAAVHQLRLIAAAQDMTGELVAVIQANRIGALQPGHAGNQISIRGVSKTR